MRDHLAYLLVVLALMPSIVQAQSDVEEVERIFRDEGRSKTEPVDVDEEARSTTPAIRDLSPVRNLEPYQNFVAIQRRFLPKSNRFELHLSGGAMVNDPFFYNLSLMGRLGYDFSEAWGIEAMGLYSSGTARDVTNDLHDLRGVGTQNLLTPQSFYGGAVKWSPFYGKIAYFNRSILSFDHFFEIGAGVTNTNQSSSPFTFTAGTGQIYSFSKSWAFRWDLLWLTYNTQSSTGGATQFGKYNNVFLTAGVSFFFPEVGYR